MSLRPLCRTPVMLEIGLVQKLLQCGAEYRSSSNKKRAHLGVCLELSPQETTDLRMDSFTKWEICLQSWTHQGFYLIIYFNLVCGVYFYRLSTIQHILTFTLYLAAALGWQRSCVFGCIFILTSLFPVKFQIMKNKHCSYYANNVYLYNALVCLSLM